MIFIHKNKYLLITIVTILFMILNTSIVFATSTEENVNNVNNEMNNEEQKINYDNELYNLFSNINKNDRVENSNNYEYLYKYRILKNESIYFFKNANKVLDVEGFEVKEGLYKALVTLEFSSEAVIYQWVTMERQTDGYYLITIEKNFEDFYNNLEKFDSEAIQFLITVSYDFNNLTKKDFIDKYFKNMKEDELNEDKINEKYNELKKLEFFSLYMDDELDLNLNSDYNGRKFYTYDKEDASILSAPFIYLIKDLNSKEYILSFDEDSKYFDSGSMTFILLGTLVAAVPLLLVFLTLVDISSNSGSNSNNESYYDESNTNRSIHDTLNSSDINDLLDNEKPSQENTIESLLGDTKNNKEENNQSNEKQLNTLKENNNRNIVFDKNQNNEVKKIKDLTKTKRSIHYDDENE